MRTDRLYAHRFTPDDREVKKVLWQCLNEEFLSAFIGSTDTVCDIGAGTLEFLETARAKTKIAVDPQYTGRKKHSGIACYPSLAPVIRAYRGRVNVVMLSNVLEHLPDHDAIERMLTDIRALLTPGGRLLIIQPTIDLVKERYWDFFDHLTPITRTGLLEVLGSTGYDVRTFIPRFLPYTTKSRLPLRSSLLRAYLRIPWRIRPLAGQCFVCAVVHR